MRTKGELRMRPAEYEPGIRCDCQANAYEWKFCAEHERVQTEFHKRALAEHAARSIKTDWLE